MPRQAKSQWNFGELFPPEDLRKTCTVSELTAQIRERLERDFNQVRVSGEVTNLRVQPSGHIYFTLKDAGAQLSCVLFRGEFKVDRQVLQDGRKLTLEGEITVYEPRGQYQLRVTRAELEGVGALQAAFEKLKQKLKAEGLFAQERKRPLPPYARRVGVVTSSAGAALRDVLHVVRRRNPALELVLAPCRVQGDGAAAEIAAAIRMLNSYHIDCAARGGPGLDLVLVTRGGGSLEDLWCFNEEAVARAVFESALPVVSAVGHEIDFTICDFVADVRAATPSAAAEIITEAVFASLDFVRSAPDRLALLTRQKLDRKQRELTLTGERLARMHPRRKLEDWLQHLDDLQACLGRAAGQKLRERRVHLRNLYDRLGRLRPALVLKQRQEVLDLARQRLRELAHHRLRQGRDRMEALAGRLRLLGPEQVLARGYSLTFDAATGLPVRDSRTLRPGQSLRTRLAAGEVGSRVETITAPPVPGNTGQAG